MKKAEFLKLIEELPDDAEICVADNDYDTADEPVIVKADASAPRLAYYANKGGTLFLIQG